MDIFIFLVLTLKSCSTVNFTKSTHIVIDVKMNQMSLLFTRHRS